jgi:hypothetical protein
MSELLLIVSGEADDEELVAEVARRRPRRVTVLLETHEPAWADSDSGQARATRDRIAWLLHTIEEQTGAAVVGTAGDREQLRGWRFDRVVGGRVALAA